MSKRKPKSTLPCYADIPNMGPEVYDSAPKRVERDRAPKRRSLDERLGDAGVGRYSRDVVERFAKTELWRYLYGYPEHLAMLEETLGVEPDAPFHQVAALIWARLGSEDRQTCENGAKLMCLLAAPLIDP